MRLTRDRAERHCTGRETFHDLGRGLDVLERDARHIAEAEAAAQRAVACVLVVHEARVLLVCVGRAGADGVLEHRDRVRVPVVVLAVAAPRIQADHRQERVGTPGMHAGMTRQRLFCELADADAADPGGRPGEVALDQLGPEADSLEDLRAAVRRDRRDAHLRHRLEQALRDALRRAVPRLCGRHLRGEPAELDELAERLEHEIGIHGRSAVPDEDGDAMHAAGLAGLDDDSRLQARACADEMVVHGPSRKQGGNRHTTGAGTSVGEDEDVRAGGERDIRLCTDSFDRGLEPGGAVGSRPGRVDRPRLEDLGFDAPQLFELLVEEDGVVDDELPRVLGRLGEQIALGADTRAHAHHDRLADRVDGRVRHLCEELLEIRIEQGLAAGEDRERRIVAHR